MEDAQEVRRQIAAQVEKLQEADRHLKPFENSKAYKEWMKSTSDEIDVKLVLWPNGPNTETMVITLSKSYASPECTCRACKNKE